MNPDPTKRFSSRVENYIRYRPGYPTAIIDFFHTKLNGTQDAIIADIGSGTGILTELFLKNGNPVFGVEPNQPMREAAERLLQNYPNFKSIAGTAEATTLPDQSVDFVIAGQAFHWFEVDKAKKEFQRILRPSGKVLLIWNTRDDARSEFMEGYNEFLKIHSTDYQKIMHRRLDEETFREFFGNYEKVEFENFQTFDLEALKGRYLSSSYSFEKGHSKHDEAMLFLKNLFDKNQKEGEVKMWYKTEVFFGELK